MSNMQLKLFKESSYNVIVIIYNLFRIYFMREGASKNLFYKFGICILARFLRANIFLLYLNLYSFKNAYNE